MFFYALPGGFWVRPLKVHKYFRGGGMVQGAPERLRGPRRATSAAQQLAYFAAGCHSPSVFVWCGSVFDSVRKGARVYICTAQNPGICNRISGESLSVSLGLSVALFSLRNQNYPWIVSECVSMSICESALSNLSRSFSFGRSATDRFDTMMPGVAGYTQTLLPPSLSHTHREREGTPLLSRSHTVIQTSEKHTQRTCVSVSV
jgi:hypothetical protein